MVRNEEEKKKGGRVLISENRQKRRHAEANSHQHRSLVSIKRVDCGTISSLVSIINDVIMNEGGSMEKLHHGSHANGVVTRAISADCIVRKKCQRGSNTLATGGTEIIAYVRDHLNA